MREVLGIAFLLPLVAVAVALMCVLAVVVWVIEATGRDTSSIRDGR
jgi:hypothetical protein